MRLLIRSTFGMAWFAAGLTALLYGIAQAIETGSCGTDEYGRSVGPPCPSGFGEMILLMILGAFVGIGGAALFSSRDPGAGPFSVAVGLLRFFSAAFLGAGAAVVLAIVDVHADDTRPGREIMIAAVGAVAVVTLPALLTGGRSRPAAAPGAGGFASAPPKPPPAVPVAPANPEAAQARAAEIASRLQQLDQLRQSGLLGDDEYAARRKQILGEL